MNMILSLDTVKSQAKSLRQSLAASGHTISHSEALELIAKQHGHRDWNTLHASLGNNAGPPWIVGSRVTGAYLGRRFAGEIIGIRDIADGSRFRITVRFDKAVDVIPFESMSNLRKQVNTVVDRAGRTWEKTSDGQPHMVLDM